MLLVGGHGHPKIFKIQYHNTYTPWFHFYKLMFMAPPTFESWLRHFIHTTTTRRDSHNNFNIDVALISRINKNTTFL